MSWNRIIAHLDMDAFYASVEQRDDPHLKNRAIAVGGSPKGRGVVAAASYEARKFGVRSAMSAAEALRLCPQIQFVSPNFEKYQAASKIVLEILSAHANAIEPLSLDEAYMDLTNLSTQPLELTEKIKSEVYAASQLTCSVGVANCKFIAKIASAFDKPDGITIVPPSQSLDFISPLPVRKLPGVGPSTEKRLKSLGVNTVSELRDSSLEVLKSRFGKFGERLFLFARAQDDSVVRVSRERKSISCEDTFEKDLIKEEDLRSATRYMCKKLWERTVSKEISGKTVTLKITFSNFEKKTKRKTLPFPISDLDELERVADELLEEIFPPAISVRLIGIGLSSLGEFDESQLGLNLLEADKI